MTAASPPCCTRCGRPRAERDDSPGNYTGAHGWCLPCCRRWYNAGRPAEGPPPALSRAECAALSRVGATQDRQWRMAECARLLSAGFSRAQAAKRLSVTVSTAGVYERELRDQGVSGAVA